MKYLIVKGALGFGDRLQSLKMCVLFAQAHNLQIYVDWSDFVWSHGAESFYSYFKLNMPTLKSIDDIPEDATVYPPYWKGKLKDTVTIDMYSKSDIILGYLTKDTKFDADVIVAASLGNRHVYANSTFFYSVFRVIDPRIVQKVKERQKTQNLKTKIGIHLRGTDRATAIDKTHRMAGVNIRMVGMGLLNGTKFVALSDDPDYVKIWKARYPDHPLLTEVGNLGGREGVHNKPKGSMTVSKDSLNVDSIVDFLTLASCRSVMSTSNDSRFAQESQKANVFINQILA